MRLINPSGELHPFDEDTCERIGGINKLSWWFIPRLSNSIM